MYIVNSFYEPRKSLNKDPVAAKSTVQLFKIIVTTAINRAYYSPPYPEEKKSVVHVRDTYSRATWFFSDFSPTASRHARTALDYDQIGSRGCRSDVVHAGPRLIKLISIGPLVSGSWWARTQIYTNTFTVLRQCRRRRPGSAISIWYRYAVRLITISGCPGRSWVHRGVRARASTRTCITFHYTLHSRPLARPRLLLLPARLGLLRVALRKFQRFIDTSWNERVNSLQPSPPGTPRDIGLRIFRRFVAPQCDCVSTTAALFALG